MVLRYIEVCISVSRTSPRNTVASCLNQMQNLIVVFIALFTIIITGCNGGAGVPSNLQPAALRTQPVVNVARDPGFELESKETFTTLPRSEFSGASKQPVFGDELVEREMLFYLRSIFESHGFRYVEQNTESDFIVSLDGANDYRHTYIPPKSLNLPEMKSMSSVTAKADSWSELLVAGGCSQVDYRKLMDYSRLKRGIGVYYPSVAIMIFDSKTRRRVWSGVGIGVSSNPDIRVSSQLVIRYVTDYIGLCEQWRTNLPVGSGVVFSPYTPDGYNVFPLIERLDRNSRLYKVGLRPCDMILAINGAQASGKSCSRWYDMLSGDSCKLTVLRGNKQFEVRTTGQPERGE